MERALVRPLVDDTSPRLRVRWIAPRMSEDANVLIFTIDHCICDGVSVVTLLRELVEDCARDLPERPSLPAIGALEQLLFAQTPPPKLDLKIEKHDVPLVPKRLPPGARSTSLRLVDLTREETLALGARAKSLGTSVNGLLVASALKAAASVSAPGSTSARLGLITNVSLRGAVEPPVSEEAIGNFVSFVHTFHVVDATTDLGALSRECRDAIAARIAAKEAIGRLRVGALRWWERGALKHVATRLRHGIDNAVAVSNTGRLKLSAPSDRVRVEAVYAASAQHVLGSSLAVFAWTIDDVMHLCFGFPSPIVDAEKADAAFAELVRMLRA
jgi:hypothetical protein